jgi:hypothetical protein
VTRVPGDEAARQRARIVHDEGHDAALVGPDAQRHGVDAAIVR